MNALLKNSLNALVEHIKCDWPLWLYVQCSAEFGQQQSGQVMPLLKVLRQIKHGYDLMVQKTAQAGGLVTETKVLSEYSLFPNTASIRWGITVTTQQNMSLHWPVRRWRVTGKRGQKQGCWRTSSGWGSAHDCTGPSKTPTSYWSKSTCSHSLLPSETEKERQRGRGRGFNNIFSLVIF